MDICEINFLAAPHEADLPREITLRVGSALWLSGMLLHSLSACAILISLYVQMGSGITKYLHSLLQYSDKVPLPKDRELQVGVVLGYALHRNGSATAPLKSRVEVGVALFAQRRVSNLIFSGSHPGGGVRNVTEANAMWEYAKSLHRVDSHGRWFAEELSTSTRENALFSVAMAIEQSWTSLVIVTNPFHQLRSALVFQQVVRELSTDSQPSMQVFVAQAPFAPHCGWGSRQLDAWLDLYDFLRELAAIVYYWARGWIRPLE